MAYLADAGDPAQLLPAREQMAFTLGFHIILVPFGVAFTFFMLVANLLGLAALGIVLRGSGFAFRKAVQEITYQRVAGAAFAATSVVTPFFFGTVAGGIASGRVPGGPLASWVNPTSLLAGVLAVAVCAYLAAVFLTADAPPALVPYFRQRAWITAWVTGLLSIAGIVVLRADAPHLFDGLLGRALPIVILSVLAGLAALILLRRATAGLVRALAALAVAAIVVAWGVGAVPVPAGHARGDRHGRCPGVVAGRARGGRGCRDRAGGAVVRVAVRAAAAAAQKLSPRSSAAGQESSPGRKSASTAAWLCTGSRTLYSKVTRGSRASISRSRSKHPPPNTATKITKSK
jgi:Cytochrome bd terminal oxidase subunit II